ncbi:VRR-NUC domain-containing protein [Pseudomonas indica]|uniref:VRR-NUC domain-containing protein n=1 Tax=Pseudomonas indica TaxID=137658 RepID=UPI003FD0FF47
MAKASETAPIRTWQLPPKPCRAKPVDFEGNEQIALFRWLQVRHPEAFKLAYHVPNGGHRVKAVAAKLKAQGVKAGVSDVCLPMARGGYFGLYLEFKATPPHDAVISPSQLAFQIAVEQQGYMAVVCRGLDEAMRVLDGYMAMPPTQVVRA